MRVLRRWFLPESPDVLGLLGRQAEVTIGGMQCFAAWSESGAEADATAVRDAEHDADDARRALLEALSQALTTPLDQEDLYLLSERLDAAMNAAKNTVRQAEALGIVPDEHAATMGYLALEAVERLSDTLGALGGRHPELGQRADAAIKCTRRIEHAYRDALAALPGDADARETIARRELYRGYLDVADAVDTVATRAWYALLKGS